MSSIAIVRHLKHIAYAWLERRDGNQTFSVDDYDPETEIEQLKKLLNNEQDDKT